MAKRKKKAKRSLAGDRCKCVESKRGSVMLCKNRNNRWKFKKGTYRSGVSCSER